MDVRIEWHQHSWEDSNDATRSLRRMGRMVVRSRGSMALLDTLILDFLASEL